MNGMIQGTLCDTRQEDPPPRPPGGIHGSTQCVAVAQLSPARRRVYIAGGLASPPPHLLLATAVVVVS